MSTLYELTTQQKNLLDAITLSTDEEYQEAIEAAIGALDGQIEDKADGYAKVIKTMDIDIDGIKKEEKRLADRRRALESRQSNLKYRLQSSMEILGRDSIKTLLHTFAIRSNAPSVVLDPGFAEWALKSGERFLRYKEPEPNKTAISDAIKAGEEVPYARLEQGKSLQIR